jgi:hypothetical protein
MPAAAYSPQTMSIRAAAGLQRAAVVTRLAGDRHEPAHRLQEQVVARECAPGPSAPKALIEQVTSRAFRLAQRVEPEAELRHEPGRKDSTTTSARAHSSAREREVARDP